LLGTLRLADGAVPFHGEIDRALGIAAFELDLLDPGIDEGDVVDLGVEVVEAGGQRVVPNADAADRHQRHGELTAIRRAFLRRFAIGRLLGLEIAEIDAGPGVGFDHADFPRLDLRRFAGRDIPEVAVQPILSRCQDGNLRPLLAAMRQEHPRFEHLRCRDRLAGKLGSVGRGVGERVERCPEGLVGLQRGAVLRGEEPVFARLDLDDPLHLDVVDDVQHRLEMKARRDDAGLRPHLAVDGDDVTVLQRRAQIVLRDHPHLVLPDVYV
jgi:hypothetical protein